MRSWLHLPSSNLLDGCGKCWKNKVSRKNCHGRGFPKKAGLYLLCFNGLSFHRRETKQAQMNSQWLYIHLTHLGQDARRWQWARLQQLIGFRYTENQRDCPGVTRRTNIVIRSTFFPDINYSEYTSEKDIFLWISSHIAVLSEMIQVVIRSYHRFI